MYWVEVASDLLCKCHINLRLQRLIDCDANVFLALYEAILGEKVPDYIPVPKSQEDDIHNVQSVIDSLALDYLQISLSHITGENIVRGDKDSIRNLLEIFDGLLEYLTEQLSEEEEEEEEDLQNGGLNGVVHTNETQEPDKEEGISQTSSSHSAVPSSKHSLHSWNGAESESTTELIRLGDSARTFTMKPEVCPHTLSMLPGFTAEKTDSRPGGSGPVAQATLLREPLRSAVALQPPSQTTPQRPQRLPASPSDPRTPPAAQESAVRPNGVPHRPQCDVQINGTLSTASPDSERSVPALREPHSEVPKGPVEVGAETSRRVFFRTQPDVLMLTLSDEQSQREEVQTNGREEEESEEERPHSSGSSSGRRRSSRARRWRAGLVEEVEEPLSRRSQRNRLAEKELQEMSEKLSRRLEELDLMLKRALGETGEEPKPHEEDKRSHHSDSVMECRRTPRPTDPAGVDRPPRPRSLSPSPPPARRSLQSQLNATLLTDSRPHAAQSSRRPLQDDREQQRKGQMVAEAYKAELKNLDDRQRTELAVERLRAQEAEREYREAIRKEASRVVKSYQTSNRSKSTLSNRTSRTRPPSTCRRQTQPRKTAPLRVKENDLLPTLLEENPPLPFSSQTLSSMWKKQLRQVDQLSALNNQRKHTHSTKLSNQVEEAQKRHDLLMEIIRKEQEHNRRLKDFRERIQQQKSTQNKLREQRQQVARARKYHNDYHVQLRARLLRARTREERMFRQVFEEGLELQKTRLREQRAYAKEQRQEHQRKHQDEIKAMENYYRDQFSMLAERLALERQEIQVRKKAQEKALHKMKRELRNRMEREISELQKIIVENDEDDHYRDLEVERLRRRVQMASFQYSTGCTH
ncbi:centrosomal protein of 95 kDa-like isoform X2 [Hoplias malabaricus]|uniref:centrosomal protein of 95 kDa-like isoform X2 n=1 Tax=Hoplias malabaricus TaxID=27720 RepID=UPI003462EB8F